MSDWIYACLMGPVKLCLVKNVLHVPDLRYQLLSMSAMSKLGVKCPLR